MPLLSAAISDKPTGSHVIDRRATKNWSIVVWRREKYTPTAAMAARYPITIAASSAVKAVCISDYDRQRLMRVIDALLERRSTVYVACAASLALGLFFIFVWTPLPWGWKGIDGYDAMALSLARGGSFPTVHIVWGYAYFLAIFYWLFGNHPAVPLTAQAILNATIPLMLYHIVRREMNERIAMMAALLAGFLSFNTIYASTQASDAMCTVLVVAALLCFQRGDRERRPAYFVAAGLLAAAAYQFRPNLVLLPGFIAAVYLLVRGMTRARLIDMTAFLAIFLAGAIPWIVRNYRWTGLFIPASTHGGVQLWFGTLQTGPYQESWLYNPRAAFEFPPVDYTSLDELPPVVTGTALHCDEESRETIELVYWTNRDRTPKRLAATPGPDGNIALSLPIQPAGTAVYYYFDTSAIVNGQPAHITTPPAGAADPFSIVISRDHLGDLDVDDRALDVYDIVRMMRHLAWREPLAHGDELDFDGDHAVTEADLRRAASLVIQQHLEPGQVADRTTSVTLGETEATLAFVDGSSLGVSRGWSGKITDLTLNTPIVDANASLLVSRSRSLVGSHTTGSPVKAGADRCMTMAEVAANRTPYRRLPHELRRFMALSWD